PFMSPALGGFLSLRWQASAPAEGRGDKVQNRLDHVYVVVDAELIGDVQEQRVSLCDVFVLREFFDEDLRLGGVAASKNRAGVVAEKTDLVPALILASEVGAVAVVHQGEDAAADRHP